MWGGRNLSPRKGGTHVLAALCAERGGCRHELRLSAHARFQEREDVLSGREGVLFEIDLGGSDLVENRNDKG